MSMSIYRTVGLKYTRKLKKIVFRFCEGENFKEEQFNYFVPDF